MAQNWRQSIHLEPQAGWLNDPNGLCFSDGKYHVYFQYSPDSPKGARRKCWGHFESSDDGKSWEYTGIVMEPDIPEDRSGVYSGCAVVKDGILHIFYTGNVKLPGDHDYVTSGREANQIYVTSKDGRTVSSKKIILRNSDYPEYCSCHVRDPKVWIENGVWKMVLGARTLENKGCVLYYEADDPENWHYVQTLSIEDFGYMWECPDQFTVGDKVFLGISPQGLPHEEFHHQNVYSSGYFKKSGDALSDFEEFDYGFDFYAPQTFLDRNGETVEYEGTELLARAFCHELDHLEGTLFNSKADDLHYPVDDGTRMAALSDGTAQTLCIRGWFFTARTGHPSGSSRPGGGSGRRHKDRSRTGM